MYDKRKMRRLRVFFFFYRELEATAYERVKKDNISLEN